MPADWPLVGRDAELRPLKHTLVDCRRGVVLAGPVGVGKSRLFVEALDICRKAGFAVARVTATRSSAEIPLGAFATLLPTTPAPREGQVEEKMHLLQRCAEQLTARAIAKP